MELLDCTAFLFLNFGGAPYLHSGYSNLHPHQQGTRVPVSSHNLLSFWIMAIWQVWDSTTLRFWFAFLWWLVMLNIFSCVWWPFECLFCGSSAHLLIGLFGVFFFSDVVLYEFFSYFGYWSVIVSGCCNLSKAFSEYTEVTVWFLFLSLLMWCIMPTDLWTEAPRCPGGSSLQCRTPGLGSQMWGSEPTLFQENLYDCDHLLFCGSPTWQCGLNYTMSLPLLPISWRFLLYTFSCGKSFLLVFRSFLSIVDL